MIQDFNSKIIQDALAAIQKHYNIVVVFHPSEPQQKKVYIVVEFTYSQNMIPCHTLKGKDITSIIDSNQLSQYVGTSTSLPNEYIQRQTLETKFDEIPIRHYSISPDWTWVLYHQN